MRIPFESETHAFLTAVGFATLTGVAVLAGLGTVPALGVAVFVAGAAAAIARTLNSPQPATAAHEPAARPARRSRPRRHVLVVASEALGGDELPGVLRTAGTRLRLDVLAPVLCSRAHQLSSDYDAELRDARARLATSLEWAASQGFEASGEVGDPDPLTAVRDELRAFEPDEVVLVTDPRGRRAKLEGRLLERLRRELGDGVRQVAAA